MRYLVDKQVLLFALLEPERLPPAVRTTLESPKDRIFVSAGVAWDIALNEMLGRIRFACHGSSWLPAAVRDAGFTWLPVTEAHALGIADLLRGGGAIVARADPFDRLLASQALIERATVLCVDGRMTQFGVPVLWR